MKKIDLAKKLKISHSAIVQWEQNNKIPDSRIFEIAPLINTTAEKLKNNPNILFNLFHHKSPSCGDIVA